MRLVRIGYWNGNGHEPWPDPTAFVDASWDADERALVVAYLRGGMTAASMWGSSACRLCGEQNGSRELTDGTYLWPDGLAHYLEAHDIRLPAAFVDHARNMACAVAEADVDEDWWRGQHALAD